METPVPPKNRGAGTQSSAPAPSTELPFVSVIVPVYNGRAVIAQCLRSLLEQEYPRDRYEVIVADNGSTDDTAQIARQFPVELVDARRRRSSYAARNDAAGHAVGALLAFCDADERVSPAWMARLAAEIKEGYAGAAGAVLSSDETPGGAVAEYSARDATFLPSEEPSDIQLAPTGNVMYRRTAFEQLGGFREDTLTGADFEFSLRATNLLGLKIRFVPSAVVWHQPRSSLGKLLRHEARIAYGREWASSQHQLPRRPVWRLLSQLIVASAASTGAAVLALFRDRGRRSAWRRAATIMIHPMMLTANTYGRILFRMNKPIPRHW